MRKPQGKHLFIFTLSATLLILLTYLFLTQDIFNFSFVKSTPESIELQYKQPSTNFNSTTPRVATIVPEQNNEWGTFSVPELSYSMQYPFNWKLSTSESDGYPYIHISDSDAQPETSPQLDIVQGVVVEIYTTQLSGKNYPVSSLMDSLSYDPTVGLYTDPTATIEVKESSVGQINGARSVMVSKYKREEAFAFFRNHAGKTLLYRIVLTIHGKPEDVNAVANRYLRIFEQMLNTLEFTSTE